jgi:uncharacterized protein YbjT (DUF2867 family)
VTGATPARRSILVTGATGRQGGAVARRLLAERFAVRILTRHAESAAAQALAASGAVVVPGDFDDPPSLARALTGVSGVFSMQTPYEAGTAREEVHGIRLADAAAESGVEQFVYSSVASADRPTGVAHFESKGRIERHIATLEFRRCTVLRPTFFMEMLLSPGNLRSLASGRIELTFDPRTRVPMIAVEDIANMAAAAFLDPDAWHGKAIDLAGDAPNFVEVAAAFGAALGREVTYRQVAPDAIDPDTRPKPGTQHWLETAGWPIDLARLLPSYPFAAKNIGRWARANAGALAGA